MQLPVYLDDFYSDAVIRDPFPVYAQLREMGPVVYMAQHDIYALPRYTEVASVLRQPKRFISSRGVSLNDTVNKLLAGNTLNSDPPVHDQTRAVTAAPLLPGSLKVITPRIQAAAEGLIDTLVLRGRFDAISDLAQYLPVTIVAELVGLPETGREKMLTWASATFNLFGPENNDRARAAFDDLRDLKVFLDEYGTPEKLKPGGWAQRIFKVGAEQGISYETCAQLMRDYINPSLDTTISATGQAIRLFADNPSQWDLVRERPELIPNAVEEVVRLATPIRAFTRYTAEDSEVAGVTIPQGKRVLVMYASANRDERKFAEPERFDVTRDVHDHLGFGTGVHMCMGMHLARLEMVSLLQSLARRVKRITLDGEPVVAMNNVIRAYTSLPVAVEADTSNSKVAASAPVQAAQAALQARITARKVVAQDIVSLELESIDEQPLPPFRAGDHIDVRASSGLLRQYSLTGDPSVQGRYRLGILLDPKSRGGSATIHAAFHVGQVIEIGRPRNNFPLRLDAEHSVLFAGGIGITPILSMAYALALAGRSFELHYCGRSASRLAFLEELQFFGDRVQVHLDDGPPDQRLDIEAVLASPTATRHLYVCGPNGFMDFVTNAADRTGWSSDTVHLERFGAEVNTDGAPFTVVAARSQVSFDVLPGERIAEKLRLHGISVPMSCQSGVCGTCLVNVVDGMPDHRDSIQTDTEKASNRQITVCCSRSKTRRLVLDL
ncbi:cytochrome P450/oxidoreductase [Comamonas thiooxydans]|uniref:Cytochrome P450/oxidoreductase n=1 Tax=Comamonas thiooxydans TaxID=363952 RepID=A0AA42TPJ2_9BURK|nr:cytochrome P450/oxidoreductase [Comamonas thiooxydans]MDH1334982.1 cytochrome P450/oxidoreductase [Comamonas thiooxydans]MDH1741133.1 cytochrome P450/oxidoreductase [Comamonas thiooxydans]MDH1787471.1 cytochrome P450/oxidoreductase [Comamonas thiooxydans]